MIRGTPSIGNNFKNGAWFQNCKSYYLTFIESLYAIHCTKHTVNTVFNQHSSHVTWVLLSSSYSRWGNWSLERPINLPKFIQQKMYNWHLHSGLGGSRNCTIHNWTVVLPQQAVHLPLTTDFAPWLQTPDIMSHCPSSIVFHNNYWAPLLLTKIFFQSSIWNSCFQKSQFVPLKKFLDTTISTIASLFCIFIQ